MEVVTHSTVIFLDVDGVLHPLGPNHLPLHSSLSDLTSRADEELASPDTYPTRVCDGEFTPECMSNLKKIVADTGASIVLSSTWRETHPSRLAVLQQLAEYDIPPFVGCTPIHGSGSNARASEITAYARENNISKYIALDDQDMDLPPANFVRTDMGSGLTASDAKQAIKKLLNS